jgi:hypothetical protein
VVTVESTLYVVVRNIMSTPEVLGAWPDREHAAKIAADLGEGHWVEDVRLAEPGEGFVAHVWRCRAAVRDGQVIVPAAEVLPGASRVVFDSDDMPAERVHVDDQAATLEASVHGHTVHYVDGYAATPERARELAEAKARELADQ